MEGLLFRPQMSVLGFTTPPASIDTRSHVASATGKNAAAMAAETVAPPPKSRQSCTLFPPLKGIWPGAGITKDAIASPTENEENDDPVEQERENWVMKILNTRSVPPSDGQDPLHGGDLCLGCGETDESDGCFVGDEDEDEEVKFNRRSFSKLLKRVPLEELRLFLKLSDVGSIAYVISKLNPTDLLRERGMTLVASSADDNIKPSVPAPERESAERAASAYQIAASAASYLQSRAWGMLPFGGRKDATDDGKSVVRPELESLTAVVAAEEETKRAVAEDLNSSESSPCEWFVCDEDASRTRFFVIQGSESFASWQANLLFEPIPFEGLDVLVHRGIYEAAKGIYKRMLPHVRDHLKSAGPRAVFRFTGHSLGGSLSLLISLMLILRGEIPSSSLLPVVTFGAPSIMCGGDRLLRRLGLPTSHVRAITMHRDIVPRAFSCNYPDHVAEILKAVNSNFRRHPCLQQQKLLYAPMGELLILQPEERFSPEHELLPAGTGLYVLAAAAAGVERAAKSVFFNSPHPLEILSDRAAYGAEGTVYRDHDVNAYLRSVRGVVENEVRRAQQARVRPRRPNMGSGLLRLAELGPPPFLLVMFLPAKLLFVGALSIFPLR